MPSSPTSNRKLSNPSITRNNLVERCSSLRGCEPCKRRKRICNGQKPCTHCTEASQECVYSVVSDHPRSVFSTNTARRLSSGSACETCRRRKTKCDGQTPCSFCATSGIECINNSERRKRSSIVSINNQPITSSSLSTIFSTSSSSSSNKSDEAIDRIEDRLQRIERLMTAFAPSRLPEQAGIVITKEIKDIKRVTAGFRKLSSPHLKASSSLSVATSTATSATTEDYVRQHRHSIHGPPPSTIAIIKKNKREDGHIPYASPPNSGGSIRSMSSSYTHSSITSRQQQQLATPSPPLTPRILKQSSSSASVVATSLLNLSLSPSSSSTSSSSGIYNNSGTNPSGANEWKKSTPIPSVMDQLSKYFNVSTTMDYTTVHFPIYPISSTNSTPISSTKAAAIPSATVISSSNNNESGIAQLAAAAAAVDNLA